MIELNAEQRQAMAQGQPVQIIDPLTHDAYVLVPAEVYARLAGAPQRPAGQPHPEISPMMLRSMQAFWRDLPELLEKRRNHKKWAAYHGDERVAITRSDVDAYQECFRRGLKRGEFYVGRLEADPDGIPPWGTFEGDWSLYEATDGSPRRRRMKILDRLPIPEERTSLRFGDRYVTIHRNQILVWVSVHLPGSSSPRRTSRGSRPCWTPGNNFGFSMQDRHLREWAGIDPGLLAPLGDIHDRWAGRDAPGGDGLALPEHPRPAGGGRRPAAVPAEDRQGDRGLRAGRRSSRPAVAAAGASRPPRQRPRFVARSGAAARHGADPHLAQAAHASPLPIVTRRLHGAAVIAR